MHITNVGELFIPGKTHYQEGVFFEYTESGPMLLFAFKNPTEEEILAARKGKIHLALYEDAPIIFLLHKIDGLEKWSDSPFSIRLYEGKTFDWSDPITEGMGIGLHIILVDADTGILLAQRLVGMPTKFSHRLREAILRQLEVPFSVQEYHNKIGEVYRTFTTKELLQRAVRW